MLVAQEKSLLTEPQNKVYIQVELIQHISINIVPIVQKVLCLITRAWY